VDLFEDGGYERLVRALKVRAEHIKKPVTKSRTKPEKSSSPGQNKEPATQSKRKFTRQTPAQNTAPTTVVPKPKKRRTIKIEHVIAIIGVAVAFIGVIATLVSGVLSSPLSERWFPVNTVASATPTLTVSITLTPTVFPSQSITLPPTYIEIRTPTLRPSFAPSATDTSSPTNTVVPSHTATSLPDLSCVTINELPLDNTQIKREKTFKVKFTIVNNGSTVWPEDLTLDITSNPFGTVYAPALPMRVPRVQPGDYINVGPFDAKAPKEVGHYVVSFRIGDGFCRPYIAFDVVK
jgi:hypothetical protein